MELTLQRRFNKHGENGKEGYCIGDWIVNGKVLCHNLEDEDRGLDQSMPLTEIARIKKKGRTAIPTGRYQIKITWSPKFKRYLPILVDVPGYEGIRIHSGRIPEHTEGCPLPGMNTVKGEVHSSGRCTREIIGIIERALKKEDVWLTIKWKGTE